MEPSVIAALVADRAPAHVQCRAQEFVEFDGIDSKMVVQCSCNVRLTLAVPAKDDSSVILRMKVTPDGVVTVAHPKKGGSDGA